jgi:2-polyprenyl-3-methyl-5-hydroxy-6-metoxy-1,4-benzoquinol methylase
MSAQYFENYRAEMLPFIPTNRRRVLEIGCSSGFFSGSLDGVGETWGIEPSAAADEAAKHLTTVIRGYFDDVKSKLPKCYFDVVICNDVIEHMQDHQGFLKEIGDYIAPGGMLVGSIPNVRFYNNLFEMVLEKDWLYRDDGILDRTHLAFFTEKSLRRTLDRNGLRIVQLEGINTDYIVSGSRREKIYLIIAKLLTIASLGYFRDIRHLQFAFQATPKARS